MIRRGDQNIFERPLRGIASPPAKADAPEAEKLARGERDKLAGEAMQTTRKLSSTRRANEF